MQVLFSMLWLASLVLFFVGLFAPSKSLWWHNGNKTRGLSFLVYGMLALILGSLSAAMLPDEKKDQLACFSNYEIIKKKELLPNGIEIHVILKEKPTSQCVRSVAEEQYDEVEGDFDKVFVFVYEDMYHYNSGFGWLGTMSRIPPDQTGNYRENATLIEDANQPPVVKWEIEESDRRNIYAEMIMAERKADKEAEEKYGIGSLNNQKPYREEDRLTKIYKMDVANKYKIPINIIDSIGKEGSFKLWGYTPSK